MRDSSDSNPLFYDLMLAAAKRSLGLEYGEYQLMSYAQFNDIVF